MLNLGAQVMVNVSYSQPIVFGYTPPAPSAGRANTSNINKDIKAVTEAIKASVASTNSNRTAYLITGIALLAIAAIGAHDHSRGVEIDQLNILVGGLKNDLASCRSIQTPFAGSSSTTLSPDFETTPYENRWSLDPQECEQIIKNTNPDLEISKLFLSADEAIVDHFSVIPNTLDVNINGHIYRHEKDTNLLAALIKHNCHNTVASLSSLFPKFDTRSINIAQKVSAEQLNFPLGELLRQALTDKGVPISEQFIDRDLWTTDLRAPGYTADNTVTVKVPLQQHFPLGALMTPQLNLQQRSYQQQMHQSPSYAALVKHNFLQALERNGNARAEDVKRAFIEEAGFRFFENPKLVADLLNDSEVGKTISKYDGLSAEVNQVITRLKAQQEAANKRERLT